MPPNTKNKVKRSRIAQLVLRLGALLGALGLLFCVIAINKTTSSVGWIIRVAPAVALCHCVYGIYHLCRAAEGRTPASTASYMLFAAMLDTGLIPFLVFSAMLARAEYTTNAYGWSTLFGIPDISYKIIYGFFLLCVTEAGLVLLSLGLDIYLAILFRKIAKLPPDMNPLEPNLTARPNHHKRNKSEMTTEKHMSTSTLATMRGSNNAAAGVAGTRRVPFTHTRTESADSVTLYGNDSARNSRVELRKEFNEQGRDPYRDTGRQAVSPARPNSAVAPSIHARIAGSGLDHKPARSSGLAVEARTQAARPASWLSYVDYEGLPRLMSPQANEQLEEQVRPLSPVSALSERDFAAERNQLERENWYQGSPTRSQLYLPVDSGLGLQGSSGPTSSPSPQYKKRSREPLAMNPPTPQPLDIQDENDNASEFAYNVHELTTTPQRSALHSTNTNSEARPRMGSRPSSFVGSGGKTRFYGNLRSSIGSVNAPDWQKQPQFHVQEMDDHDRSRTMQTDDSGNFEVYDQYSEGEESNDERLSTQPSPGRNWNGARQTSNSTGFDLPAGYAGLGPEFGRGMGRRREVSGKVAEEGRGYGGIGVAEHMDGGVRTGQSIRGGAAGWARFKGL